VSPAVLRVHRLLLVCMTCTAFSNMYMTAAGRQSAVRATPHHKYTAHQPDCGLRRESEHQ